MKIIAIAFIVLVTAICANSIGNEWTDSEIKRLTEANKKIESDMKAAQQRLNLTKGDTTSAKSVVGGYRRSMGINSEAIRLLKLEALDRPGAPVQAGEGSVYAPRFVIVPETNRPAIAAKAAPVPPVTKTNAPPPDWRTAEQRAKWEAIKTSPPTKVIFPK